jgi:Mg2+ and Co2+ transporter CorA
MTFKINRSKLTPLHFMHGNYGMDVHMMKEQHNSKGETTWMKLDAH